MARGTPQWVVVFYILGMLVTGTLNTICTKIQFTLTSVGINGQPELFHKPWFSTLNMMAAMGLVGAIDKLCRSCTPRKADPLLPDMGPSHGGDSNGISYMRKVILVSIPAAFDILATALCAYGMMYIPASIWQMFRGSSIVFAALFSITFLRRRMYAFNWLGLALCVGGVGLVGVASVWGDASSSSDSSHDGGAASMIIGMLLVLAGQVVQAGQIVAEEFLMKNVDLPGMQVIGLEGAWGTLMMFAIAYPLLWVAPGSDGGHLEDPFDTYAMLANSSTLTGVILIFFFSCATFNATGIKITAHLSGVHRMMLDASRTVLIWLFGLVVHYCWDKHSAFGEAWTPYSYLQLVGFGILMTGQAVYGEVLRVPTLKYPAPTPYLPSPSAAILLTSPLPHAK
mmetsp:Transcript_119156/g.342378  ORF Transcript_119156/g.342378 Transcript_119156/m.342378 type:complete len:397 (+) Transcript_119156:59-1249(+)